MNSMRKVLLDFIENNYQAYDECDIVWDVSLYADVSLPALLKVGIENDMVPADYRFPEGFEDTYDEGSCPGLVWDFAVEMMRESLDHDVWIPHELRKNFRPSRPKYIKQFTPDGVVWRKYNGLEFHVTPKFELRGRNGKHLCLLKLDNIDVSDIKEELKWNGKTTERDDGRIENCQLAWIYATLKQLNRHFSREAITQEYVYQSAWHLFHNILHEGN